MRARATSGLISATLVAGAALAVAFVPPAAAAGCTNSWVGPSTGTQDWFTAANWSAGVPSGTDDVCITKNGTYVVEMLAGASVNSVTVGGTTGTQTLRVSGATSSVQVNTAAGSASIIKAHGVLAMAPSNGYTILSGGTGATLSNSGTVSTLGTTNTAYIRLSLTNLAAGSVSIANSDTRQDSGTAATNSGSWTVAAAGNYFLGGGSTFAQNAGTLAVSGTFIQNGGTFAAAGGVESGTPVYVTGGTISEGAMTGAIAVRGSSSLSGNIPVGQAVTVDTASTSVSLNIVGASTVLGTLTLAPSPSGYAILSDGGAAALTVGNGGTLATTDVAASQPAYLRVPITNNGTVTLAAATNYFDQGSNVTNTATFSVASGASAVLNNVPTFTQTSGALTVDGAFALTTGTFAANGGSVTGANPVDVGGATLAEGNPGTSGNFRFRSAGAISGNIPATQSVTASGSATSLSLNVSGPVIVRGTLDIAPTVNGYVVLGDAGSAAVTVANGGTLSTHGASDAQAAYLRVPITNNAGGSVSINAPTTNVDYGKPLTNNGALTVSAAATMAVSGSPTITQSAGTLAVQGNYQQTSGTFVAAGGAQTGNPIGLYGAGLDDTSSTMTGAVHLFNNGPITGNVPVGQTVTVDGANTSSYDTVIGATVVRGTLTMHSSANGYTALGDGGGGSVTVANGGTFSTTGSGQTAYLRIPLTIQSGGTAHFDSTSTTQDYGTATTNNGTATFGDGAQLVLSSGSTFVNGANATFRVTANGTTHTSSILSGPGVTLGGTLAVTTIGTPTIGDTFTPVTGPATGTFADYDFPAGAYTVSYPGGAVVLTAADVFGLTDLGPFAASKNIPTGPLQTATVTNAAAGTGTYSATVNWGDNTTPDTATVTGSGATRTVTAPSHTYASSGTFTLTTRVHNSNGTTQIVTTTVTVPVLKVTKVTPDNGYTLGGTRVTIKGSGFTGATAVQFDGINGTALTVVSDTQLKVTSPAHAAGTINVRVVTPGGTSPANAASEFTYVVPPPDVTSISPDTGPSSGGQNVTITGTNLTGATAVQFGGIPAASFTVVNDTTITAVTPLASAAAVAVTVTTAGGTSDGSVTYTFVAAPRIRSVTPVSGPVAGGNRVVISGTDLTGATSVTFGGVAATGLTVVNDHKITVIAPAGAAGTVAVRVTTIGGMSNLGAKARYTYVLAPAVTAVSPGSGPAAGGTSVVLTGTSLTGATSVRFGATPAASFTVDSDTQITAVSPAGAAGAVYVRVTTSGGTSAAIAAAKFKFV